MLNNEKILAVRSGCLGSGSSELRSLVYYIGYLNIALINFNLFQKKYPAHILYVGISFKCNEKR